MNWISTKHAVLPSIFNVISLRSNVRFGQFIAKQLSKDRGLVHPMSGVIEFTNSGKSCAGHLFAEIAHAWNHWRSTVSQLFLESTDMAE